MEKLLILLVFGLIALFRWLFLEGGLKKILGKFESDLNEPNLPTRRDATLPTRRTGVPQSIPSRIPSRPETAEEERIRKFKQALGLPLDDPAPVAPPRIPQHNSGLPADRARLERQRIERRLEEKRAALSLPTPTRHSSTPVREPDPEESSVSDYFQIEKIEQPAINSEKIPDAPSMNTENFFTPFSTKNSPDLPAAAVLGNILGNSTDLRRMILAQEILGHPKSLQNG